MADVVKPEVRSRMMSSIRAKDTLPELIVRRLLHREGFRYRLHVAALPGKPDLVFPSLKAVIFIHGCYWHGHDCPAFKLPSTNRRFWRTKLFGNRRRDQRAIKLLNAQGWRVLVIWECATRGQGALDSESMKALVGKWLLRGKRNREIRAKAS